MQMNSKERIKAALLHQKVDRIPVANLFNISYFKKTLNLQGNIIEKFIENPIGTLVKFQEEIKHDSIIQIYTQNELTQIRWPNTVFTWPEGKRQNWLTKEEVIKYEDNSPVIKREYITPEGSMTAQYKRDNCQNWTLEHPLKEEKDIELLRYRPDPEDMDTSKIEELVKKVGGRAFIFLGIPSPWHEACSMRGLDTMIFDMYDRPEWVKELLSIYRDYSVKLARKLAKTGIDCLMLNESSGGFGISRDMFEEFLYPVDRDIIQEINRGGVLSNFHICGKCNNLLELMADSGATCIEPLAPPDYSGDIELADAKRRVGDKVGLWGGFKERLLTESPEEVKKEAIRCLDAASAGGGYVLRGAGQIYDAKIDNLKLLYDVVTEYSAKNQGC